MRKLKYILVLLINLSVVQVFAGNDIHWAVIDKSIMSADLLAINHHYQQMRVFEANMTDASYEDYTTSTYHQKLSGYFKRDNDEFHSCMIGVHTIQNKVCRIVIDSAKKMIIVADPTKSMDNNFTLSDYDVLLKVCTKLQKAKAGNLIYYHMEFQKDYKFSAYDITLKDSLPSKVVMYYNKKVKQGNRLTQPRMEISYDKWVMNVSDKGAAFAVEKYVVKKGDNYVLTSAYAGKFKLLDQRVLSKTTKKQKP